MKDLPSCVQNATPLLTDSRRAAWQARTAIRSRALFWFLAISTLAIIGLLVSDSLLQREERALRWIWLIIAMAAIVIPLVRLVIPALLFRCNPFELASWVEKQKPDSAPGLTIVLELAETPAADVRYGSVAFREAAMAEQLSRINLRALDHVVSWTPVLRAGTAFLAVVLSGVLLFSGWPDISFQAFRRLVMPWSAETWPTRDQLEFVDLPTTVGFGSSLRLEIIDRKPPLPNDVQIEMREVGDESLARPIPVEIASDVAVATLPALMSPTEIRATGGDDRLMEWRRINVMAIPIWKSFRFEITLPDYLRSSPEVRNLLISDSARASGIYWLTGQTIDIPAGSKVRFLGELDRSVVSVKAIPDPLFLPNVQTRFNLEDTIQPALIESSSASRKEEVEDPLAWYPTISAAGTQIVLVDRRAQPLEINRNFAWSFQFEMENHSTLNSPGKWMIEAVQDQPPEINLVSPPVTSIAVNSPLPLVAAIRDDWELREVRAKLALASAPNDILEMSFPVSGSENDIKIDTFWSFSGQMKENGLLLRPEETLTCWIEAIDSLGQTAISQKQSWSIESQNRQLEILAQQQSGIAEQLEETLELQKNSQELSQELFEQLSMQSVNQSHIDTTSGIVQLQHTIRNQLSDSNESVLKQIEQILSLLQQNGLADTELHTRMAHLQKTIAEESTIDIEAAASNAQKFREVLQSMADQSDGSKDWKREWAKLNESQSKVSRSIDSLVENLNSNQSVDRMAAELQSIASQQQLLLSATNQFQMDRLQQAQQVSPAQLADLSKQQLDLARQMEHWLRRSQELFGNPSSQNSDSKRQFHQASELLSESQVAARMRDASQNLQTDQLGGAIGVQTSVDQSLQRALEYLALDEQTGTGNELSLGIHSRTQRLRLLRESLENFILRQRELNPLYLRLSELLQSPASSDELQKLSKNQVENQESLRDELMALRSKLDQLPLFQWSLDMPSSDMSRAVAMARRKRFAPDAASCGENAVNQLTAILRSLERSSPELDSLPANGDNNPDSKASTSDGSAQAAIPLASLRLIRSLQMELAHQTQTLDEQDDGVRRNNRRSELAVRQQELAEKMQELMDEMRAQVNNDSTPVIPSSENLP